MSNNQPQNQPVDAAAPSESAKGKGDELAQLRARVKELEGANHRLVNEAQNRERAHAEKFGGKPGDRIALRQIAAPPKFVQRKGTDAYGREIVEAVRVVESGPPTILPRKAVLPPEWWKPLVAEDGTVLREPEARGLREGVDFITV